MWLIKKDGTVALWLIKKKDSTNVPKDQELQEQEDLRRSVEILNNSPCS